MVGCVGWPTKIIPSWHFTYFHICIMSLGLSWVWYKSKGGAGYLLDVMGHLGVTVLKDIYFLVECRLPFRGRLLPDFLGVALFLAPPEFPFPFPFFVTFFLTGDRERSLDLLELLSESLEPLILLVPFVGVFVFVAPPRPRLSFFCQA